MTAYTSVHNHSEFSNMRFFDSTIKTGTLIDRAIELGYNGVCLTDHEAVTGHVRFQQRFMELREKGKLPDDFMIGLGNEIYLTNREEVVREDGYTNSKAPFYHFILVARDRKGHRQLRELSSAAWGRNHNAGGLRRSPTYKEDVEKIIGANPGHVIASTACLGGEVAKTILAGRDPMPFINWCIQVFGKDSFFLELQPRMAIEGIASHDQVLVNQRLVEIADRIGVPYIVTTDSHYLRKEDRSLHEAFLNSDPKNSKQRELSDFYETAYMMSLDEIEELLSSHLTQEQTEKAIANTKLIHDSIEFYDLSHPVIVPVDEHVPDFSVSHLFAEWYDKYPYIKKFAESDEEQERYFLHLIEKGFVEKNFEFKEEYIERINRELETIAVISENLDQRLATYYVLVQLMIHNILWQYSFVGPGRGSVNGFFTAYLSDIIQVNPLEYGLKAWRHLSPERPEIPDRCVQFK